MSRQALRCLLSNLLRIDTLARLVGGAYVHPGDNDCCSPANPGFHLCKSSCSCANFVTKAVLHDKKQIRQSFTSSPNPNGGV